MLQKQAVNLNFAKGLDTKSDPFQVQLGNFLTLENTVFTTGNLLKKRNGFGELTALPNNNTSYLTTFNGNLTGIGTDLQAYASGPATWINKGHLVPITLSTLPLARSAVNIVQSDAVVSDNNLVCTVYTENNNGTFSYKYLIQDAVTGQNVINPTNIPISTGAISGSPRVFFLQNYFVIIFTNTITATSHLQYLAISTSMLTIVQPATDIATYIASPSLSWDGVVLGSQLFVAYNTTTGGQAVNITYLTPNSFGGSIFTPTQFLGSIATIMSLCVDNSNQAQPRIYISFYDDASNTGFSCSVDQNLIKKMTPTQIISVDTVYNITSTARSGRVTVAYEVANTYTYDSTLATNYLNSVSVTAPLTVTMGTVGSTVTFIRSVGLASKAFLFSNTMYLLAEYASEFQPTYFLLDISGNIYSRFAYENGGASLVTTSGYLPLGLPQAQVIGSTVNIAYLFKDLIQTTNSTPASNGSGAPDLNNVYSQVGVNLSQLTFSSATLSSSEIGQTLNITGGMLWAYDGQLVNEQGFHIFPDNVEATPSANSGGMKAQRYFYQVVYEFTDASGNIIRSAPSIPIATTVVLGTPITFTSVFSAGATSITVSSATGLVVGQYITDSTTGGNLAANTYITSISGTTVGLSQATLGNSAAGPGDTLQTVDTGKVTLKIPTLRLTYKPNVKIQIYRWSTDNQIYYQITSVVAPTLNNKTVDFITYVDTQSDNTILGNNIIYTTGDVLENIAGPSSIATTLYDDRLWLIDAEDQNLLWFSKQVIEATPVEMSDLLTVFVAPSIGAQGSTGTMKCIAPMDDKLIIFKEDAIYYLNGAGQGPDNTGANNNYSGVIFITSSVGSANQNSIVLIPQGLMFQSDKGIWLLGRNLETNYIGAPVEAFNQYTVSSAQSIPGTTQVRFTLSNGSILMYDYFYEQWGTFVGAPAISSTLYQGLHTIVNSSGAVSQETVGNYLDNGNPVLLQFTTSWINLAGLQGYQRAYFFYILGKYLSPHKLNIEIAYDYNPSPTQSTLISPSNFAGFYGSISPYGQETYGGPGDIELWRVFLAQQRCMSFQISLKEVYDPSFGVAAGAGLTISGLNLVAGLKKGYRPTAAAQSMGGGTNRGA